MTSRYSAPLGSRALGKKFQQLRQQSLTNLARISLSVSPDNYLGALRVLRSQGRRGLNLFCLANSQSANEFARREKFCKTFENLHLHHCRFSKVTPNARPQIKDFGMTFENSSGQFLRSPAKFLKPLASYRSRIANQRLASDINAIA